MIHEIYMCICMEKDVNRDSEKKVKVAQLYLTLCDPMDCSPPDSSVHGISQAKILEWVTISCSRGSSGPRRFLYHSSHLGTDLPVSISSPGAGAHWPSGPILCAAQAAALSALGLCLHLQVGNSRGTTVNANSTYQVLQKAALF